MRDIAERAATGSAVAERATDFLPVRGAVAGAGEAAGPQTSLPATGVVVGQEMPVLQVDRSRGDPGAYCAGALTPSGNAAGLTWPQAPHRQA